MIQGTVWQRMEKSHHPFAGRNHTRPKVLWISFGEASQSAGTWLWTFGILIRTAGNHGLRCHVFGHRKDPATKPSEC